MNHYDESPCAICGGEKKPERTLYSVDLGFGVVVVRNVPASVCVKCGNEWFDNDVVRTLHRTTEKARENRCLVAVAEYEESSETTIAVAGA